HPASGVKWANPMEKSSSMKSGTSVCRCRYRIFQRGRCDVVQAGGTPRGPIKGLGNGGGVSSKIATVRPARGGARSGLVAARERATPLLPARGRSRASGDVQQAAAVELVDRGSRGTRLS